MKKITRAKAFEIQQKTIKMVGDSRFNGYCTTTVCNADGGGRWYADVTFIDHTAKTGSDYASYTVWSDSNQERIDRYFKDLADFLNKF